MGAPTDTTVQPADEATVQVKDTATGQPKTIPLSELKSAVDSGKYETSDSSTVNTNTLNTPTRLDPNQAAGVLNTGNSQFVPQTTIGNQQTTEAQRKAYDTIGDKALTFAEGITDSLTFGFGQERGWGPEGDPNLRREINSGSQWAGEMAGIAIGLATGNGESQLAELGETLGKRIATTMLGEGKVGSIAGRILGEAGANAAISTAQATGHQTFDSLFSDKPIAVEAIAHEAGMGALLGAGFGAAGSFFGSIGSKAGKAAVDEGISAPDFIKNASTSFDSSIHELRMALRLNETRFGVLSKAVDEFKIPDDFHADRAEKLEAAQDAEKVLIKQGSSEYALNATAKQAFKWQQAFEDFHAKVQDLDQSMTPKFREIDPWMKPVELNNPANVAMVSHVESLGPKDSSGFAADGDNLIPDNVSFPGALQVNEIMYNSPELQAKYREAYGRNWEDIDGVSPQDPQFKSNVQPDIGKDNLGGKKTPTSENNTGVGKRRASVEPSPKIEPKVSSDVPNLPPGDLNSPVGEPKYDSNGNLSWEDSVSPEYKQKEQLKTLDAKLEHRKFIDDWTKDYRRLDFGTPASRALNKISKYMEDLNSQNGGRLDAAGALNMARGEGFGEASTELGQRFQQSWTVNKLADEASKASRLAKEKAETKSAEVKDKIVKTLGTRLTIGIGGAVIGGGAYGQRGALLGASLATGYLAFGGRVAGVIAKLKSAVNVAGEALLKGRRSTALAQGIANSISSNQAWSYSDRGPIKDPIDRIQEIQHVAAHPDLITAQVTKNTEDLNTVHSELHQLLTQQLQQRMVNLSIRAPKFVWDKFGQPLQPEANLMRRFHEYENAANDLPGTLDAISRGVVTKDQADSLRDNWPAWHTKLTSQLLNDPAQLKSLAPVQLNNVEKVTGLDFTGKQDGQYLVRQQASWGMANENASGAPKGNPGAGKPQAFKIRDTPSATSTPTQSVDGKAPGN